MLRRKLFKIMPNFDWRTAGSPSGMTNNGQIKDRQGGTTGGESMAGILWSESRDAGCVFGAG